MFGKKSTLSISQMKCAMKEEIERWELKWICVDKVRCFRRSLKTKCPEEIVPMLEDLMKKAINDIKGKESVVDEHIESFLEIVDSFVRSVRNYEKFSNKEILSFQKIFDELEALFAEIIDLQSHETTAFSDKIRCIWKISRWNQVYMTFQDYEDLWQVIHRLNTEWKDLCDRGFRPYIVNVFLDYVSYAERNGFKQLSEEEKLETFMKLLDGQKWMVPIYRREYQLVGFEAMDERLIDEIIEVSDERGIVSYRLCQKGEEMTEKSEATED